MPGINRIKPERTESTAASDYISREEVDRVCAEWDEFIAAARADQATEQGAALPPAETAPPQLVSQAWQDYALAMQNNIVEYIHAQERRFSDILMRVGGQLLSQERRAGQRRIAELEEQIIGQRQLIDKLSGQVEVLTTLIGNGSKAHVVDLPPLDWRKGAHDA